MTNGERRGNPLKDTPPELVLFKEIGGSYWTAAIGPVLCLVVFIVELSTGNHQTHWPVLLIFAVIIGGFSYMQTAAARQHVSVLLTDEFLVQGAQTIDVADIAEILPANTGSETQKWEVARPLGELSAVPRRRKGIGVVLKDGSTRQAWARNVEMLRSELTQAHQAIEMGIPPRRANGDDTAGAGA